MKIKIFLMISTALINLINAGGALSSLNSKLIKAAQEGHFEIIKDTLAKNDKVKLDTVDENLGRTMLHWLGHYSKNRSFFSYESVILEEIESLTEILINRGANIYIEDTLYCETPLHLSVIGTNQMIPYLLRKAQQDGKLKDYINKKNIYGFSALHLAVMYGKIEVTEILIKLGADVNLQDNNGATPLIWAVRGTCGYLVDLLMGIKFDINGQVIDLKNGANADPFIKNNELEDVFTIHSSYDFSAKLAREKILKILKYRQASTLKST